MNLLLLRQLVATWCCSEKYTVCQGLLQTWYPTNTAELDTQGVKTAAANEVKPFLLNGIEVMMRFRVIGGLWVMGLNVDYPDAAPFQEQTVLVASEDLTHHRLCHLSHVGMVRLAAMV